MKFYFRRHFLSRFLFIGSIGIMIFEAILNGKNLKKKYMTIADNILKEALKLTPSEKAQLIDKLIAIFDKPDKEIDVFWAEEAEDRLDAYDQGRIKAISLERVLQKYR